MLILCDREAANYTTETALLPNLSRNVSRYVSAKTVLVDFSHCLVRQMD